MATEATDKVQARTLTASLEASILDVAAKEGFKKPRLEVESGSGPRDGYTSVVDRVRVFDEADASKKELNLICKTSMDIFGSLMPELYALESYFYEKVAPAMEEIAHLKEPLPWPRCVCTTDVQSPPPHTMVMVDLRPDGFGMADRTVLMDEKHCRLALTQMARMHGAGLALQLLRPEAFEAMKKKMCLNVWSAEDLRKNMKPYNDAMIAIPDVVKDKFPEGSEVNRRLKRLFDAFKEDSIAIMGPFKKGRGFTLIHNDLHVNNMMFQFDKTSGEVIGCRLIDFQMAVFGNPALDIVTIMLVCTGKPMRDKHWDSLIRGYHQQVLATLRDAGVADPEAVYPWSLLQELLKSAAPYGLCMAPVYHHGLYASDEIILKMREQMIQISKGASAELELDITPFLKEQVDGLVQDVVDWGWLPSVEETDKIMADYKAGHF